MPVKLYTIDPDGDLLLRLTCPADEPEDVINEPMQDGEADLPTTSEQTFFTSFVENANSDEKPSQEIHFLVSSKHLRYASPVFKAMLQPNFKEGSILQSTGKLELDLPDDDPDAFEVLLNIVHGRTKEIPRRVDIHTMAGLATLADKYRMIESIELCSELLWMPSLKDSRPKEYNSELISWLTVAWICKLPEEFRHFTRLAVREGFDGLSNEPLPIPESVTEAIEEQRQQGATELFSVLQDQIDRLIGPQSVCQNNDFRIMVSFGKYRNAGDGNNAANCDAMTLGSLLKSANELGLYPPPLWPYKDSTLKDLISRARRLNAVSLCDATNTRDNDDLAHGVLSTIAQRVISISNSLNGLNLNDFK